MTGADPPPHLRKAPFMTIVFADPNAMLTAAGLAAEPTGRPAARRPQPAAIAELPSATRPGPVRQGLSAVLVRMARSLDPAVEQGLAGAR